MVSVELSISGFPPIHQIEHKDFLGFSITSIRPVAEYSCPVFHTALPQYLSKELARLQMQTLHIIWAASDLADRETLESFNIPT